MITIKSAAGNRRLYLRKYASGGVYVEVEGDIIVVDRADFLAAVATELDCIVIPRADLPEVTVSASGWVETDSMGVRPTTAPPKPRKDALALLAIAEHLATHPPVDEADVDALERLMREVNAPDGYSHFEDLARRLLATGRVAVKREDGAA